MTLAANPSANAPISAAENGPVALGGASRFPRRAADGDFCGKSEFFFLLALDAVRDGPILFGIRGYVPGKKSAAPGVETAKTARIKCA
ncbi:hypothetical protein HA44_05045 [Mixta gaviniae]|nr:hypothetical protein HA44_05045 [Mixta gaviniae]